MKCLWSFRYNPPKQSDRWRLPSIWNPPQHFTIPLEPHLEEIENLTDNIISRANKQNLTKSEKSKLKELANRSDIVIKEADKGSAIVIMDKDRYIREALRQLEDPEYYRSIEHPLFPDNANKIAEIMLTLRNKNFITKKEWEYLTPPVDPRPRIFYMLPKIHKDPEKWSVPNVMPPGRPIVSDCASESYASCEFIDHFLQPISKKHPSFVKDTYDLIDKLSKIALPYHCFLVSLDVDALYTNISIDSGMEAIKKAFIKYPDTNRPDKEILELLEINLRANDFMFDEKIYLQVKGTAMGRRFAPSYANIFMALWEEEVLGILPIKPLAYFRYLDDIFLVWPGSKPEFQTAFEILNNHHPCVKLKYEIDQYQCDFLDITMFKGRRFERQGILDLKVYFKPTDTHALLHKLSFHPKHTHKGVLKSQIIRFFRICNNNSDFLNACTILFEALKCRGYSDRFLRTVKSTTLLHLQGNAPQTTANRPAMHQSGAFTICGGKRCHLCDLHPPITTTFQNFQTGDTYSITENISCNTRGVIYLITCQKCFMQYIGETSRTPRERLSDHKSNIRHNKDTPIANHFDGVICTLEDLSLLPISTDNCPTGNPNKFNNTTFKTQYRQAIEQCWISEFNSLYPNGMNIDGTAYPPKTDSIIPIITVFGEENRNIARKLSQCVRNLKNKFPGAFSGKPIVAYKRNKNFKDLLTSSALKPV